MVCLTLGLFGSCTSNMVLRKEVKQLSNRDVIVQVGQDRELMLGKKLTEVENREEFIFEMFRSISWVKQTSKDFQAKCKEIAKESKNATLFKQCASGIDPGATTPYGKFSSQVYSFQHLIAPESMSDIMAWILKLKPEGYDNPQSMVSRSLQITHIGTSEPFSDGKNGKEMRTPAEVEFTESDGAATTRKFKKYFWIYTRNIIGPTKNGAVTPFSEAAAQSQRRGLYLTRILPYTNTPL